MLYTSQDGNLRLISLNRYELRIMVNVISEVCQSIPKGEFETRVGSFLEEVAFFLEYIRQKANNDFLEEDSVINIEISRSNFYTIWQSFNEVCHGLYIDDYVETVGFNKLELERKFVEWMSLEKYFSRDDSQQSDRPLP